MNEYNNDSLLRKRNIPINILKDKITRGKVFQMLNFLTNDEVNELRKEIDIIDQQGKFKYSGLTNRANTKQDFDKKDRQISPIVLNDYNIDSKLNKVGTMLLELRKELSIILNRPTLADNNNEHEVYFSKSSMGALLPRHLDERHEEIKGRKGWLCPSRRSISWLIYLSSPDWSINNGGELRSYPQICNVANNVGCDDGNLQIGWLKEKKTNDIVFPVFLDISRRSSVDILLNRDGNGIKLSALYIKRNDKRKYITKNFDIIDSETGSARTDYTSFLFDRSNEFYRIEEIESWSAGNYPTGSVVEDFLPVAGSLVLFDSVSLPHEVMVTKDGNRLALAGWFHEQVVVPT